MIGRVRRLLSRGAVLLALPLSAASQIPGALAPPDGEAVLKRMEDRWAALKDYTVTLDVVADIEKMDIPPMHVRMYFKQPDKTHFESDGFAVLPREALRFNARGLTRKFAVEEASWDTLAGRRKYRLRLISRGEASPARRMTMMVDPRDLTVDRLEAGTADGRRMKASFDYGRVENLPVPVQLVVEFVAESPPVDLLQPEQMPGRSVGRKGTITVKFSEYKINSGLPDDLFNGTEK